MGLSATQAFYHDVLLNLALMKSLALSSDEANVTSSPSERRFIHEEENNVLVHEDSYRGLNFELAFSSGTLT